MMLKELEELSKTTEDSQIKSKSWSQVENEIILAYALSTDI